jgi:hypothetical protein
VRAIRFASLAAAIPLAVACSKPAPPTLDVDRLAVTRIDLQGVALDATISATNSNSVDLTVNSVTSHLVLDKTHDVGTVTIAKAVTLPAGQKTSIDVPVTMTWTDVGSLAQLSSSAGAVPYAVDGSVELGGSLLHVAVPFHLEGSFTHQQIAAAMMSALPHPR